jgi:hypothetical protein
MIRRSFVIGLVLSLAGVTFASNRSKEVKLTGYVVDNACAAGHAGDPAASLEKVKKHPHACATMPNCAKSGYSILADGKFYKFDEEGNKKVLRLYKTSKSKVGLAVKVEGTLEGDTLHVKSISEVTAG